MPKYIETCIVAAYIYEYITLAAHTATVHLTTSGLGKFILALLSTYHNYDFSALYGIYKLM